MKSKVLLKVRGFTLVEIIVSISLFLIIILMVSSVYDMVQKAYSQGSNEAELLQNARVTIDRISRELRQSTKIVTLLPISDIDPLNPPSNYIMFQDGHDLSQTTYIKYYLEGENLKRSSLAYYFNSDPSTYVYWNSIDVGDGAPIEKIINSNIVGEYFSTFKFWGSGGLINFSLELKKNQKKFMITTSVYVRN